MTESQKNKKAWAKAALFLVFGLISGCAMSHGFVWLLGIVALATIFIGPHFVGYGGVLLASLGVAIGFGLLQNSFSDGGIIGVIVLVCTELILWFSMSLRNRPKVVYEDDDDLPC